MIPVISIIHFSIHEKISKTFKGLIVAWVIVAVMEVIGDTSVLGISTDIDNFAAFGENGWRKHG